MMIEFLFRVPEFPIIGIIDDLLIAAGSEAVFQSRIDQVELKPGGRYHVIDSVGAEWEFAVDKRYVMPTLRRKWSKKRIIQSYNQSHNCRKVGITYSEKITIKQTI